MVISMRVRPETYEEVRRDAEREGRSIAAEAERRFSQRTPTPAPHEVARMVSMAIEAVERQAGKSYADDETVRFQCRSAAEVALNLVLGSRYDEDREVFEIRSEISRRDRERRGEPAGVLDTVLGAGNEPLMPVEELIRKFEAFDLHTKTVLSTNKIFGDEGEGDP